MLTTIQKAENFIPETPEPELTTLLAVASAAIEDCCKRKFKKQAYSDKISGLPGGYIRLPNYPVETITAKSGDKELDGIEILRNGVLYRKKGWPMGDRRIIVNYVAGYVLPDEATNDNPATLPEPIEFACIMLAQHLQRSPGVISERVGDISVNYAADQLDMPLAVKSLLGPYIRPDF